MKPDCVDHSEIITIERLLWRDIERRLVVGFAILAMGVAALLTALFMKDSMDAFALVEAQVKRVSTAGVRSQELIYVQRELERFSETWHEAQGAPVTIEVSYRGRPIAQTGNLHTPTYSLSWPRKFAIEVGTGEPIFVLTFLDISRQVMILAGALTLILLLCSFLVFTIRRSLRVGLARVISPLREQIGWVKDSSSASAESELSGVDLPFTRVSEILDLRAAMDGFVTSIVVGRQKLRESIQRVADTEREAALSKAIAFTMQTLAHDVRKPFTSMQMGLKLLEKQKTIEQMKKTVEMISGSVGTALVNVNGLIQDVMEIGNHTPPRREPTDLTRVLFASLKETMELHPRADIAFECQLAHDSEVLMDELKMQRVFSNILTNAIQAMREKGRIWIHTYNVHGNLVEIVFGNDGSFISEKDIVQLFEAFYTKDKAGGTGLGLAIAQKVVNSHGGSIRCVSTEARGVEFFITLPRGENSVSASIHFPNHSREFLM